MICDLVVKCATLIAVIHALRVVGRRAGPRASGLILGLPSSTAILLVLCGAQRGTAAAIEMADAGLLGLIAAVALPLAYAVAVQRGARLPAALAAAVSAYAIVASALGLMPPSAGAGRLVLAIGCILAASVAVARIEAPAAQRPRAAPSARRVAAVRTIIPLAYVIIAGTAAGIASPRWAGLIGTFPSMTTVVLAATHLEEGAAPAVRMVRALPAANLSTAAFLAAFHAGCPAVGLGWGIAGAYLAALFDLAAIEWVVRSLPRVRRIVGPAFGSTRPVRRMILRSWRTSSHRPLRTPPAPRYARRMRPAYHRRFAPRLEMLPC